jgi:hypothetical protein
MMDDASCQRPNKQLQRTVIRRRGDNASAPRHYALALRFTRQRAAAELRRYAARMAYRGCRGEREHTPHERGMQ